MVGSTEGTTVSSQNCAEDLSDEETLLDYYRVVLFSVHCIRAVL